MIMKNTKAKIIRMECKYALKFHKLINYKEVLICIEM